MTIFDTLALRTEYESIVYPFELNSHQGDINSLKAFIQEGHKKNRFRVGYDRAFEIAELIIREATNGKNTRSRVNI